MPKGQRSNLVGQRFGLLEVIEHDGSEKGVTFWLCQCDCGALKSVRHHNLTAGHTRSCGARAHAKPRRRKEHRLGDDPFYVRWRALHTKYGMCDEWQDSYEAFKAYVQANMPEHHWLRVIDTSQPVSPDNLTWTPYTTERADTGRLPQGSLHSAHGLDLTLNEWSDATGVPYNTLYKRIRYGWSVERAIAVPGRPMKETHHAEP